MAKAQADMAARRQLNGFIEGHKASFGSVIDLYSNVAAFLVEQGVGEATDVLLIDERLCVGCDNCEKACADSHDGLSRLDREAGGGPMRTSTCRPRAATASIRTAWPIARRMPSSAAPTARSASTKPASAAAIASATALMA